MLRTIVILFYFANCYHTIAQCSTFDFEILGFHPASCRTSGFQTGNGVVYALAMGGTEPYQYIWENLETGQTTSNTAWGGLNTGLYQIQVIDDLGCVLLDTVQLDSISPVAMFDIVSANYDSTGTYAFLPFHGQVVTSDTNCTYMAIVEFDQDTTYSWQIGDGSSWIKGPCIEKHNFLITTPGLFQITLSVTNKNGCTDTVIKVLNAVPPTYAPIVNMVFCDYTTGDVIVILPDSLNAIFLLYELNGNIKETIYLEPGVSNFNIGKGVSFYSIIRADNADELTRGKLVSMNY